MRDLEPMTGREIGKPDRRLEDRAFDQRRRDDKLKRALKMQWVDACPPVTTKQFVNGWQHTWIGWAFPGTSEWIEVVW